MRFLLRNKPPRATAEEVRARFESAKLKLQREQFPYLRSDSKSDGERREVFPMTGSKETVARPLTGDEGPVLPPAKAGVVKSKAGTSAPSGASRASGTTVRSASGAAQGALRSGPSRTRPRNVRPQSWSGAGELQRVAGDGAPDRPGPQLPTDDRELTVLKEIYKAMQQGTLRGAGGQQRLHVPARPNFSHFFLTRRSVQEVA